jgi:hypothetical protein
MRSQRLLVLAVALGSSSGECLAEDWKFVWSARSYEWQTVSGQGDLKRTKAGLNGTLVGSNGIEYPVKIKLTAPQASGEMLFPSGPSYLKGTYRQVKQPGPNNCWETIQLYDGHNFLGLSRNTTCEP